MLFIVKRNATASLMLTVVLATASLTLRQFLPRPPSLVITREDLLHGLLLFGIVLVSDALIHGTLWLTAGDWYRERHRDLCATFRGQSLLAICCGAALAGVGEELLFRGLSVELGYLLPSAVAFGLLHHFRNRLWPITLWSIWQGLLFAVALFWTRSLVVTMLAHFLHDFAGFLAFRYLNHRGDSRRSSL